MSSSPFSQTPINSSTPIFSFIMVNDHILYSDNVQYCDVYFYSSLSFHHHVSNLLHSINFHLHSFHLIRNFISLSVTITLPLSFILMLFITAIFSFSPYLAIKLKITNSTECVSTINF